MKKGYTRKLLLYCACLFLAISTKAQLIYTVAGSSNPGDYAAAINASIYTPRAVAVDGNGNVYIADCGNHRIRKISASTGIITTIAGTGTRGFSGDEGQATAARLSDPYCVAVDGKGNIYIADYGNNRIRKISASTGIITTIAGTGNRGLAGDGGKATEAQLNYPVALVVDGSGDLYIADYGISCIRKITAATGIISTIAGTGTAGYAGDGGQATAAQLNNPSALTLDGNGNVYVCDRGNQRIRKVTAATGIISTIAGTGMQGSLGDGGQATAAQLNYSSGIAVDGSGNVYISDGSRIRKITAATGKISTIAGTIAGGFAGDGGQATAAQLYSPYGLALDGSANMYIADYYNHRIRKITASTQVITTITGTGYPSFSGDGGQATAAQLYTPYATAIDANGNVYIADYNNHRIRKITAATGIITTIAGNGIAGFSGDGGQATAAQLLYPCSVAVDASGNVYFVDNNHRARKINVSTGIITTIAGTGTAGYSGDAGAATLAKLNSPSSIAVDGNGNVYISDANNNRIRKVTAATGVISTIAGNGVMSYGGDGGVATSAQIYRPSAIALDGSGNLYIADVFNYRIRKVTAGTNIIRTIAGTGAAGFSGDGGQATAAQIGYAGGIGVDNNGNVFFPDANRIRKITAATGIISTIAGNGIAGFSGDGGQATAAQLNNPFGVTADRSGNLYVADNNNSRIRYICNSSTLPSGFMTAQQSAFASTNGEVVFNKACTIISKIVPSGANPVIGAIADSVWVEPSVPVSASGKPYVPRHYGITPATNASTATGTITLYYSQADFTAYNAASIHGANLPVDATDAANNKANLLIVKRSGTSNNGTGLFDTYSGAMTTITPSSVTWNSTLNRWEVTFDVSGFSGFFVATTAIIPLPLQLVNFQGKLVNGEGLLSWKTVNEQNTSHFEIERSLDGLHFFAVAKQTAAGSSSAERLYQYTDKSLSALAAPAVYYRLKTVDKDGQFTMSKVIVINISSRQAMISLYPNPVQQTATLTVVASQTESLQLRISDQNGRLVYTKTVLALTGQNAFALETTQLSAGVYTVSIRGTETQKEIRMIKQ